MPVAIFQPTQEQLNEMNARRIENGEGITMCGGIPLKAGILTIGGLFMAHLVYQAYVMMFFLMVVVVL